MDDNETKDTVATKDTSSNQSDSFLQSQLLIAMPALADPYFEHSVTLICQHNDEGCLGLTINRPIEITVDELFGQLDISTENFPDKNMLALRGGPVQVEQGFVIHDTQRKWENTLEICNDLAVTASRDILEDIAKGDGPENYLLALGCASWAPGQVETEIKENSWLNCPADKKIIFDMPYADRWQGAADTLGFDVNLISDAAGHD
ncbi:YqgE/AlgH family protein [Cocleimonas sp. KMM 6892]|uniref:YqgE/AlgH family protein n=1 Tax=unclassified Cocleimonas TaxID=2639732 RepID=UPI002DB69E1B|nr:MULTISPECIES: YqgE/AlgH family protein [unclassified Cocleimonas]MEB8432836.1 YqgE/AlgH family protein [Cocleimonas sp. KMM 6892]MEC4715695.1 YqgE/AlgH family protein [Cocleimonas sp. KMM 6895]MEC4744687.1 YqgE/AlgH family protein [Cocleimonas sp. KMM 6896]